VGPPAVDRPLLDVAGEWDPSLMFVLGGAVVVAALAFRFILCRPAPVFAERFHLPSAEDIDKRLVAGAVLFGIGWGISGYCPGPGIALLASPNWETWVFIAGLLFGAGLYRLQRVREAKLAGQPASA